MLTRPIPGGFTPAKQSPSKKAPPKNKKKRKSLRR